ncbi:hypothetical protein, partial [Pseudomonas sp. FME51]|uniref:hypothetical protein n=1 Tax=Pseudomonas sp. FME51 TaxID=2742609 RepID=UPI001D01A76B
HASFSQELRPPRNPVRFSSYSFDLLAEKFSLELSSVASKGYLYQEVYGEDLLDLKKRCKFIWSYRKEYIPESLFEDFKAVRAFKFLTGVKLRVPETGMSLMTWKEEMLADIKGGGLSMEDCERFLQIIEAIRYEEVVSKVRYVAKKLKIPVHYDFALDFELNKMGRSFDLSGCHKVIWIVAFSANKILARRAKEYAGGKDYAAAHIFRKLLAHKLELMIEGGVTPEGEVIKSKAKADAIVAFLCKHVVGDAEAWGSSTTSDFVAKFMSSIELGFAR